MPGLWKDDNLDDSDRSNNDEEESEFDPDESEASYDESDDDGSDTDPCPHCGAAIYVDGEWCPRCGKYLAASERWFTQKQGWVVVTGIILLLGMLVASALF